MPEVVTASIKESPNHNRTDSKELPLDVRQHNRTISKDMQLDELNVSQINAQNQNNDFLVSPNEKENQMFKDFLTVELCDEEEEPNFSCIFSGINRNDRPEVEKRENLLKGEVPVSQIENQFVNKKYVKPVASPTTASYSSVPVKSTAASVSTPQRSVGMN